MKPMSIICMLLCMASVAFAGQYDRPASKDTKSGKHIRNVDMTVYVKPNGPRYDRIALECDPQMLCESMTASFAKVGVQVDIDSKSTASIRGKVKGLYSQESRGSFGYGGGKSFSMASGSSNTVSGFTNISISVYQGKNMIARVAAEPKRYYGNYTLMADKTTDAMAKNLAWWSE